MKKVLITGMSGLIGGLLRERWEGKYELSALNRRPLDGVECHQADISDLKAILPAFKDKEVVVHMAAVADWAAPWEDVLKFNVIGAYNVYEAARLNGVKRVIFGSSGGAIRGWERVFPYNALASGRYEEVSESWPLLTHESPPWPLGLYGCSKVWGETLARHFTDTTDISILCIRIGHVTQEDRPVIPSDYSSWCSQRDIVQIIEKCVEAPYSLKYDTFYGVSNNKWNYRDLKHPKEVLGYVPQDSAESFRQG